MTNTVKKVSSGQNASYKLEAARHRAKLAATGATPEREIRPSAGKIRILLSGKAISRDRQNALFGPSDIDLPEFSLVRKKSR